MKTREEILEEMEQTRDKLVAHSGEMPNVLLSSFPINGTPFERRECITGDEVIAYIKEVLGKEKLSVDDIFLFRKKMGVL